MYYIGIDLGTSAVKLLLMDETGRIDNIVSREYGIAFPHPGWSEQEPADWWDAVCDGIPALLQGFDASLVRGIGAGGQMHGLVVLDKDDKIIRPCILWNDGRTQKQVDYLNNEIGKDKLSRYTANIAFAGFTAPKLLWLRDNEPENFARIEKIMLPKDYINYKLTGVHCTDYSDASGMLLLDVEHKCWSREMLNLCGVREAQLPKLFESWQPVGTLTAEAAAKLTASFADTQERCPWVKSPIPDYELTSLRGKIKRVQARLDELGKRAQQAEQPSDSTKFPGGEIVRNLEADRLQILFDEKPDEDTRAALKQNGFRWSPRYSAWQRQLTPNAEAAARRALGLTE